MSCLVPELRHRISLNLLPLRSCVCFVSWVLHCLTYRGNFVQIQSFCFSVEDMFNNKTNHNLQKIKMCVVFPLTITIEMKNSCLIRTTKSLGRQAVTAVLQLYFLPGCFQISFDIAFKTYSVFKALNLGKMCPGIKICMNFLSFINI